MRPTKEESKLALTNPSPTELEVLELVAEGLGNKQICNLRGCALMTVKKHIHSLFLKLGAVDRKQLVSIARNRKLI